MNRWSSARSLGVWLSVLLMLGLWAGAAVAAQTLAAQLAGPPGAWPITLRSFGLLLATLAGLSLGGVLLYRILSAWTLHYQIDRNAVTIRWLGNSWVVPMDRIAAIEVGLERARLPLLGALSFGYRRGVGRTAEGEPLHLFSAAPLSRSVILRTSGAAYAISPANRDAFVQEVEGRRGLGVVQSQAEGVARTKLVSYPFWTDRLVRGLLGAGLLFNLLLWAILSWRYAMLPPEVALRFDASGSAVGVAPREQLLALPLIGLLVLLANAAVGVWVHRFLRIGALLLLIGALMSQLLLAVSLLGVMLQ
ncbi:MAG TPA: PH domain-containing protein [Herpetosiphonaceae bacterium]